MRLDELKERLRLRLLLKGVPDARGLRIKQVLKRSTEAVVSAGELDGRNVVVKRARGPGAVDRAKAQADELAIQHVRLSNGPYLVPEPIISAPEHGVVIMSRAGGTRLDHAIKDGLEPRDVLVRKAGLWLAAYTELRRVEDTFGGGFWIKNRTRSMMDMPTGPDRDRVAGLVEILERERARIGPRPLTRVRSHGDFSPVNLMVDKDKIWGVDIQNNTWIALAKDLARFLVHLEITQPHGADDGICGFSAEDAEALLATPGLIRPGEALAMMPFFSAVEVSGRLLTEARHPEVMENARNLADRMLADALDEAAAL